VTVGSALRAFGRFWWDFIVGDDWKIAAVVVLSLVVGGFVTAQAATGADWLAPAIGGLIAVAFVVALVVDVRSG
jgi:hypothetical protein